MLTLDVEDDVDRVLDPDPHLVHGLVPPRGVAESVELFLVRRKELLLLLAVRVSAGNVEVEEQIVKYRADLEQFLRVSHRDMQHGLLVVHGIIVCADQDLSEQVVGQSPVTDLR